MIISDFAIYVNDLNEKFSFIHIEVRERENVTVKTALITVHCHQIYEKL